MERFKAREVRRSQGLSEQSYALDINGTATEGG